MDNQIVFRQKWPFNTIQLSVLTVSEQTKVVGPNKRALKLAKRSNKGSFPLIYTILLFIKFFSFDSYKGGSFLTLEKNADLYLSSLLLSQFLLFFLFSNSRRKVEKVCFLLHFFLVSFCLFSPTLNDGRRLTTDVDNKTRFELISLDTILSQFLMRKSNNTYQENYLCK